MRKSTIAFKRNYAENRGWAVFASTVTFEGSYSFFDSNTARDYGGAIYTDKFTNDLRYVSFTNNKALNDDGGAIYINSENLITIQTMYFCQQQMC